jgi:hypothetical protein
MRAWRLQQYPDIIAAGVSVLRRRIARLGELIRQGLVVAEVRLFLHSTVPITD